MKRTRNRRTLDIRTDADGYFIVFRLPYEALVYDRVEGRQSAKDRIDDRREELAMMADDEGGTRMVWDEEDRAVIAGKIRAGKAIV